MSLPQRAPKQVIEAILANLGQAEMFARSKLSRAQGPIDEDATRASLRAYSDCAKMIRTEAAHILEEPS
jgi:hypothetical protein